MADILKSVNGEFNKRYRDMLDGSHAEVTSPSGGDLATASNWLFDIMEAIGTDVDAAAPGNGTVIAILKYLRELLQLPLDTDATIQMNGADISPTNPLPVTDDYNITITVKPTITAGAYTAGDALGGLLTLANAVLEVQGSGMITKIVVIDDAKQAAPIDIVFFNQTFGATADNAPFDPTDADLENFIGFIDVLTTDYSQFNDNAGASKASGTRMPFDFTLASGTSLYAQAVVRGTPTYAAVGDLTFKFEIRRKCE